MTSDDRLVHWLAATERPLQLSAAPLSERLEAVAATLTERASLCESLEATPPSQPPSHAFVEKLGAAERDLEAHLTDLRELLSREIDAVRQLRTAARSYRPARGHRPAFVSRSI